MCNDAKISICTRRKLKNEQLWRMKCKLTNSTYDWAQLLICQSSIMHTLNHFSNSNHSPMLISQSWEAQTFQFSGLFSGDMIWKGKSYADHNQRAKRHRILIFVWTLTDPFKLEKIERDTIEKWVCYTLGHKILTKIGYIVHRLSDFWAQSLFFCTLTKFLIMTESESYFCSEQKLLTKDVNITLNLFWFCHEIMFDNDFGNLLFKKHNVDTNCYINISALSTV